MRGIRQLRPAAEASSESKSTGRAWNPTKGVLFALGSALLLLGIAIGSFNLYRYSTAVSFKPSERGLEGALKMIDESSAEEIWDMWHMVEHHGLGEYEASPFVAARHYAAYFRQLLIVGWSMAAIGLGLCVTALFMPSRRSAA